MEECSPDFFFGPGCGGKLLSSLVTTDTPFHQLLTPPRTLAHVHKKSFFPIFFSNLFLYTQYVGFLVRICVPHVYTRGFLSVEAET